MLINNINKPIKNNPSINTIISIIFFVFFITIAIKLIEMYNRIIGIKIQKGKNMQNTIPLKIFANIPDNIFLVNIRSPFIFIF